MDVKRLFQVYNDFQRVILRLSRAVEKKAKNTEYPGLGLGGLGRPRVVREPAQTLEG